MTNNPLADVIAANLTWARFNPEDGSTSVGYNDAAEIAAAVTTWLGQQGGVTDEQIEAALVTENGVHRRFRNQRSRIRSLLAQQAAVRDAETERLRFFREETERQYQRAVEQISAEWSRAEAAEATVVERDAEIERLHQQIMAVPHGSPTGNGDDNWNRYDTDDAHTLHLWRGGESFDLTCPREQS